MSVYSVTVKIISPVHIGDGLELRKDFEYALHNGATYRLDEDAILEAKAQQLARYRQGGYPPPALLLSEDDFNQSGYFRYRLRGQPRSGKTYASVRSFLKDGFDRPYIPGSSLKGAFRTALAWTGWKEVRPKLDRDAIAPKWQKNWAGQKLEKKLFGPDPNHDLLRALQVSDLQGPQQAGEGLALVNAQVLTRYSSGSPVELEALVGEVTLRGSLTIDESLFTPWAEGRLHFSNRKHWLDELMPRTQAHSRARIQRLAAWFEQAENGARIAQFYRDLLGAELAPNQAFLQIGWGAGWDGKTFWTHLQQDSQLFDQLIYEFRLQRRPKGAPPRRAGAPFPSSRRVAGAVKEHGFAPVAPFGWILVEMEPR